MWTCVCVRGCPCVNVKCGCFLFFAFICISARNQKKKSWLHIFVHVGCVDWRGLLEWRSRWKRTKIYCICSIYKPSSDHQTAAQLSHPPAAGFLGFCTTISFSFLFPGILMSVVSLLHIYTPVYYSHKSLLLLNIIFHRTFCFTQAGRLKEKPHTTLLNYTMNYDIEYVCFHQTKA